MKFAFSTLGCPGWSLTEIFSTAKDLGLDGIEFRGLGNEMFLPDSPSFQGKELNKLIEKFSSAQMQIPIFSTGAVLGIAEESDNAMEEAKAYIRLAQQAGVRYIRVMLSSKPEPIEANLELAVLNYNSLCEYGQEKNVTPLMETNGILAESKEMKKFMDGIASENKGVLWDIHHPYRFYHETPDETLENLYAYMKHVHIKDSVLSGGVPQYRMLGYGDVPVFDCLKGLKGRGYEGFVSLEWVKRWCPDLQEPGIVFSHYVNYIRHLMNQI